MKLKLSLFTAEMIQDAGRLLALRHQCDRKRFQLLPARFEDPQAATKAVQALWQEKHRNGYAAFRGEQMVAYLIGQTSSDPWGRSGYVYLPGYGLVEGEDPAVMQNLYVLLGDDWVRKGNFNHYLYVSAADEHFIQAWFDLGFGKERIDALLDLRTLTFPDVEILQE